MSELISGKEALIALANGEDVECRAYEKNWINANNNNHSLGLFFDDSFQFRLKPRTITINEIEVPAPFEPKEGEIYWYLTDSRCGYGCIENKEGCRVGIAAWRTEEEIKQVVAALRQVFGVSHDN
jgi:hypothetical protein